MMKGTGILMLIALTPALIGASADAAEARRKRGWQKPADYRFVQRDEDEYAARAHSRDPAGDYKAYPNWARAALGSSGRTNGGR
jgi:hypothetical protein